MATPESKPEEKSARRMKMDENGMPVPVAHLRGVPIVFADAKKVQCFHDTEKMEFDPTDVLMCGYMRSG